MYIICTRNYLFRTNYLQTIIGIYKNRLFGSGYLEPVFGKSNNVEPDYLLIKQNQLVSRGSYKTFKIDCIKIVFKEPVIMNRLFNNMNNVKPCYLSLMA